MFRVKRTDGTTLDFWLSQHLTEPMDLHGRLFVGRIEDRGFELGQRVVPIGGEAEEHIVDLLERAIEPFVTPEATAARDARLAYDRARYVAWRLHEARLEEAGDGEAVQAWFWKMPRRTETEQDTKVLTALRVIERVRILREAVAEGTPVSEINPPPIVIGRTFGQPGEGDRKEEATDDAKK